MESSQERQLTLVVNARRDVAEGVVELELRDVDSRPLPEWAPGAHIDLVLGGHLVRQYSLCGDPAMRQTWRIAILREPQSRGGSAHIHEKLFAGAIISARGPRNHFMLSESPAYLFIAGGIGITPILPMIRAAESGRADWRFVYGGRKRASMAYLRELGEYGDRVSVQPFDEVGHIDLASCIGNPRQDLLIYCCGPESLLQAVELRCAAWPFGSLRVERFTARKPEPSRVEGIFEVELRRSGVTLNVRPNQSILEVIETAGIQVLCSCCEGVCGSCETVVIDGIPEHRDSVLTVDERAENRRMMICVSRSLGPRLVLDL
ncbi:MAG: 2Fe-2S iron-sulfur cluster-binding protein [Dehalococcoidia bacterium]